jgi:membrane dipeptidase
VILSSRTTKALQESIPDLDKRSIVVDGLANAGTFNVMWPPVGPLSPKQLASIAASGITAINHTVTQGAAAADFESVVAGLAFWNQQVEQHADQLCVIRRFADIAQAKRQGKLGLIFGFQRTNMLGDHLSRIGLFRNLGVRIMQISYNERSLYGDGCLESANGGLSFLGRQAIAEMNRVGVAVDLSHCGQMTTADAIAVSNKPVFCNAVGPHPRNKNDSELRGMAEKGGVAGIYLMPFLDIEGRRDTDLVIRHLEHAIQVCGEDHVGIGSDLSITPIEETPEYKTAARRFVETRKAMGNAAPGEELPLYIPELNHPRRIESIAVALSARGHSWSRIEKIIGGNFARVLQEIWL